MPSEHSSEVKFEIGHVLFIDIVGYSKLLINEQSEQIQTLKEIVRRTEQFRLAEVEGKLSGLSLHRQRVGGCGFEVHHSPGFRSHHAEGKDFRTNE